VRPSFAFSVLAAFAFALACGVADAQSWVDVLKDNAAQEAVEQGSEALQSSADGKFLIEGHTDSTGDAAHNWTSPGAAPNPLASSDMPAGRAENRCVEFVRQ
jgi:outer membrane protein OmpA-like peptidoglycan-associated protein